MSRSDRFTDETTSASDGSGGFGGEAAEFLSGPREYIREIVLGLVVGGVLSAITASVRFGLDLFSSVDAALGRAGGSVLDSTTVLWSSLAELVALPITTASGVAAGAGVFAPLVVALSFLFAAALTGAIVWGIIRIVGFI